MSITISYARSPEDVSGATPIMRDYLEWDLAEFAQVSGIELIPDDYVANSMDHLADYMPPQGRFFTARRETGALVGILLLRRLRDGIGEVKRLYVDPVARGNRLGQALITRLIEEARRIGYHSLVLDTGSYMGSAHRLYRAAGFQDTGPYEGGENDGDVAKYLTFMRLDLRAGA